MFDLMHHTFPMGSHESVVSIITHSRTCNGAKQHVSVVDTFAVTLNISLAEMLNSLEKNFTQDPAQLVYTYYKTFLALKPTGRVVNCTGYLASYDFQSGYV